MDSSLFLDHQQRAPGGERGAGKAIVARTMVTLRIMWIWWR
jgi:hypothetical protein